MLSDLYFWFLFVSHSVGMQFLGSFLSIVEVSPPGNLPTLCFKMCCFFYYFSDDAHFMLEGSCCFVLFVTNDPGLNINRLILHARFPVLKVPS